MSEKPDKPDKPKILCVDDEPRVLEGLELLLRRRFQVVTAVGGTRALEILEADKDFAVIMSDMRMPGMDGSVFFSKARVMCPDAVRVLLTGQSDLPSTIAAVNEGRIFRFVSKPCPPNELATILDEAAEQHRLITAERVLLEQTLSGSVQTIMDVLAQTQPMTFGRATKIGQIVGSLATRVGLSERWPLEIAALLSQLGSIVLPPAVSEKLYHGELLTPEEQAMVDRTPTVTEGLIAHIPRLEMVRAIILSHGHVGRIDPSFSEAQKRYIARCAQILVVAEDFVIASGRGVLVALDLMRTRSAHYAPDVLDALLDMHGAADGRVVRELPLASLKAGMTIIDELRMTSGVLLAPGGYEVTKMFVERARNFRFGTVREPVRVSVPADLL